MAHIAVGALTALAVFLLVVGPREDDEKPDDDAVRCGCVYDEHDPWCPGTPRQWNPDTDIDYGRRSGQPWLL